MGAEITQPVEEDASQEGSSQYGSQSYNSEFDGLDVLEPASISDDIETFLESQTTF